MKRLIISIVALSLLQPVFAKTTPKPVIKSPQQTAMEAKRAEREKVRKAVDDVLKVKDTNHDGSLSKDEYIAGEADPVAAGKTFDELDKNHDRHLSKDEVAASLGLKK